MRVPGEPVAVLLALLAAGLSSAGASPQHPGPGPSVAAGDTGPARFAAVLHQEYDPAKAWEVVSLADGHYRAPGNEGYELTLDRLAQLLGEAGYGRRAGLELRFIETPRSTKGWTPRSGRLAVLLPDGEERVLHAFAEPGGVDRVMLPVNAPSADVEGKAVFSLEEVTEGALLVTEDSLRGSLLKQAHLAGALAVISSHLSRLPEDPEFAEEARDAIAFRSVSASTPLPVAQISPRSRAVLDQLAAEGRELTLHFQAEVEWTEGPLRTLVAAVVGSERPEEAVAVAAHVQEPGAGDNASGAGGMGEIARVLAGALESGSLTRPARTVVFLWGDEMRQSSIWLDDTKRKPIAGISADMLGESRERTGAVCLLERAPDPGSVDTLPPDRHSSWGGSPTDPEELMPTGLNVIARLALSDVSALTEGWLTSENPYEGGSDHSVFLDRGVPGVLIWHFTDFTYHTSLDRLDRLDQAELHRSSVAVGALALSVADLRQSDLARYLEANEIEKQMRIAAARQAERTDVADRWRVWCAGVESWLRESCVDLELP